jgi:hypothetical protein
MDCRVSNHTMSSRESAAGIRSNGCLNVHPSPRLRTPPHRHLPASDPLSASLRDVLALGDQPLVNRAGQHRDAVVPDLIAEVLTGEADGARARRAQDVHVEAVPLFCGAASG